MERKMKITTNKNDLEFKCQDISYNEGLKISKKLKQVVLFGSNKNCVGLAHNQIKGNKNVFIAKINNKWITFINATIIKKSDPQKVVESCMSFPNKFNNVNRFYNITISHLKENNYIIEEFNGFNAQIIQHEIDHLKGIHIFNKKKKK
jgi:peptide deformylase